MGSDFSSEKEARAAAEAAFLEHKSSRDWATPGRDAWMEWLDSPSATPEEQDEKEMSRPMQIRHRSNYVRLDADDDRETAKAVHFDGCSIKDEHCYSDRCGACWSQGFWVPKSKLFFDEEEKVWYVDRSWAATHDIDVLENELED